MAYSENISKQLVADHKPINPKETLAILTDLLMPYWDDKLDKDALKRQAVIWHTALKDHSAATFQAVTLDWIKMSKRKPTPADIFELCQEHDATPDKIKRLAQIMELPVVAADIPFKYEKTKMRGDVIKLGSMMKVAKDLNIDFPPEAQDQYLYSGNMPEWYVAPPEKIAEPVVVNTGPTREDLLAMMSPEERAAALRK